jgi:hypothetical protein
MSLVVPVPAHTGCVGPAVPAHTGCVGAPTA